MALGFLPRRIFPNYNLPLANFKGHHKKALTKFGHLAPQIDLVLEVRDCRAPISTVNVLFDKVLGHKEKIILYNKKDLSLIKKELFDKWHGAKNEEYMLIDARSKSDADRIINLLSIRYDALKPPPPLGYRIMIIGMPNVGKSTLVNTLRSVGYSSKLKGLVSSKERKVAKTGGQPGVTKSTSEIIRLSESPDILMYDTPGVFLPTIKDSETMLALSLIGSVNSSFIDPVIQADYLLFLLNLQDSSGSTYSEYMDHPTNSIDELLFNIALKRNKIKKEDQYDELGMATHWVNLWRQGKSRKYRGLFDLPAILDVNGKELKAIFQKENERVANTTVVSSITESFGEDGTSTSKTRKRTAKDRKFDLQNQLFKL